MTNIKIYTTESCPFCKEAKEFLKENNLEFKEINVEKNHEDAEEMIKKTGQRLVPVIDVDGTIILGFDKAKIKETLHLA